MNQRKMMAEVFLPERDGHYWVRRVDDRGKVEWTFAFCEKSGREWYEEDLGHAGACRILLHETGLARKTYHGPYGPPEDEMETPEQRAERYIDEEAGYDPVDKAEAIKRRMIAEISETLTSAGSKRVAMILDQIRIQSSEDDTWHE